MKNLFYFIAFAIFLTACGGEEKEAGNTQKTSAKNEQTAEQKTEQKAATTITAPDANPYYISLKKGAEQKVEAASILDCEFIKESNQVKFVIDEGTLTFSGLQSDMEKGFVEPVGKVYPGTLTMNEVTEEGEVKVLKMSKGNPTKKGMITEVMGIFTGKDGAKGKFNVCFLKTK